MWERVWAVGGKANFVQPQWRTVWKFLKKLGVELPYDPAIPLLGIHSEEIRPESKIISTVFLNPIYMH